ncbi:hypothetical protein [Pseudonocardia alni]|uniref:hypothetical protein n=1 Tax=Pseudonocardia alni TaxID=33907 RepID=UPI00280B0450|nr:hypothetical protein [Pseudonocardia alni]
MTDRTRLLVLVLPVLLGLLGMHALAAPPVSSGVHHPPAAAPAAAPAVTHGGTLHDSPGPSHPGAHGAAPAGEPGAAHPGPHGVPHDGASHLLHLCLAVLAAGVVLAAAVLLAGVAPLPSSSRGRPVRGVRGPHRRPVRPRPRGGSRCSACRGRDRPPARESAGAAEHPRHGSTDT